MSTPTGLAQARHTVRPGIACLFRGQAHNLVHHAHAISLVLFALLLSFLLPHATAFGATYYLDAEKGNDADPGTSERPWKTLSRAQTGVSDGDAVKLRTGNYGVFTDKTSSYSQWVTYMADEGHKPELVAINLMRDPKAPVRDLYMRFDGFTITPGSTDGPYPGVPHPSYPAGSEQVPYAFYVGIQGTRHVQLLNLTIVGTGYEERWGSLNNPKPGVWLRPGAHHVHIENCKFTGIGTGPGPGLNYAIAGYGVTYEGRYYNTHITVLRCEIEKAGTGVGIAGEHLRIEGCHIHDMQDNGIIVRDCKNMVIADNRIHDIRLPDGWRCHNDGIQVYHTPVSDLTVRGNVIYNIFHQGMFAHPNPGSNFLFENNLVYNCPAPGQGACAVTFFRVDGLTLRNNVFLRSFRVEGEVPVPGKSPMVITEMTGNIIENLNMWAKKEGNEHVVLKYDDHNVIALGYHYQDYKPGPNTIILKREEIAGLFEDPEKRNFRPKPKSRAIDLVPLDKAPPTDLEGRSRVGGKADAGCYEYGTEPARGAEPGGDGAARPQTHVLKAGTLLIARWKDDKKAAFNIVSDDGMIRSIKSTWTPQTPDVPYDGFYLLGKKHSIPITFFIDPRQLDDPGYAPPSGLTPRGQPAGSSGTWADWRFMHEQGHEIASHTYSHVNLNSANVLSKVDPRQEVRQALASIEKNIGATPIALNFPGGRATKEVIAMAREHCPVLVEDYRRDSSVTMAWYTEGTKVTDFKEVLEKALANGLAVYLGGHGIRTELGRKEEAEPDFAEKGTRYDGFRPAEFVLLDACLELVAEKRDSLYVDVFKNVARYLAERKHSSIRMIEDAADRIVLEVTHSLRPEVYDVPLTLKLSLSRPVSAVKAVQAGKEARVVRKDDTVLFDVVPNQGEVRVDLAR